MTEILSSVFDDKKLLRYLQKHKIAYTTNANNTISLFANRKGEYPTIKSDEKFLDISILQECGTFITKAEDATLHNIKDVHGNFDAPKAINLNADKMQNVYGYLRATKNKHFKMNMLEVVYWGMFAELSHSAQADKLHTVRGMVNLEHAREIDMNALLCVSHDFNAESASRIQADNALRIGGRVRLDSARDIHMASLKQSGDISLHYSMAGKESGAWLFSKELGKKERIVIYNTCNGLVKHDDYDWTKLHKMKDVLCKDFKSGRAEKRRDNFLQRCDDSARNKIFIR